MDGIPNHIRIREVLNHNGQLPLSRNERKVARFNKKIKRKKIWLSVMTMISILFTILIMIYESMTIVSKISLILLTFSGVVFSFKQFIVDYVEKSENIFEHQYVYPEWITNNRCLLICVTKCLKIFGDVNMDEDTIEFKKELTTRHIVTGEPVDPSDSQVNPDTLVRIA